MLVSRMLGDVLRMFEEAGISCWYGVIGEIRARHPVLGKHPDVLCRHLYPRRNAQRTRVLGNGSADLLVKKVRPGHLSYSKG